jgi:undecaprenyl-diphosphatase
MQEILTAVWLGLVEGITEFLPISSTGHLILAGDLLRFTGPEAKTFEVVVQFAAILAVVHLYRRRFLGLLRPAPGIRFSGPYGVWLLFLTTLPAGLIGFIAYSPIKEHLFAPAPVALALGAGALGLLLAEYARPAIRAKSLDDMGWRLALGVGLFQCLALWPGFSRAAATIIGAMFLGAERKLAAEYSFLAAVPIIAAAAGYDLLASWTHLSGSYGLVLATGCLVSFVSAWFVVKGFLHLLDRFTLKPFAYYRLGLVFLYLLLWT